jgi:uncharacterized coiled-coil DUF342 family protein
MIDHSTIEPYVTIFASAIGVVVGYKKLITLFSFEEKKAATHETEKHLIATLSKLIDDMDARQLQLSASLDKSLEELHELRSKLGEFKEIIGSLRRENAQLRDYLLTVHGEDWDHITERRGKK